MRISGFPSIALAASLVLGGADARAQSQSQSQTAPDQSDSPSTFRLPAAPQPTPRAAGPTDNGAAPVPVAPNATTTGTTTPPLITLPAPRSSAAPAVATPAVTTPRARQAVPTAAPTRVPPRRAVEPAPGASATAAAPAPSDAAPAPLPAPIATASPSAAPTTAPGALPAAVPASGSGLSAWWLAALVAVLALAGGVFHTRRRKGAARALPAPEFVPPVVADTPEIAAEPVPASAPEPAPSFATIPPIAPAAGPAVVAEAAMRPPLALTLEATRMSATLFNATLAYRLCITNTGDAPLTGLDIGGDMISAHASRAPEEQLGTDGAPLAPLHGIAGLAPGESVTLGGDLRLPLAAILPIRRGDAQLFVPLARFAAQARDPDGRLVGVRRAFLVGQSRSASADKLQPFRLDLGPRLYSELGQRALG